MTNAICVNKNGKPKLSRSGIVNDNRVVSDLKKNAKQPVSFTYGVPDLC